MTTSGDRAGATPLGRHPRWSALVLPLLAAEVYNWFRDGLSWLFILAVLALAVLLPRLAAKLAPFALFAFGAFGLYLARAVAGLEAQRSQAVSLWAAHRLSPQWINAQLRLIESSWAWSLTGMHFVYGVVRVAPSDNEIYILPQALLALALGVWLLAVTDGPGGRAVRDAYAQLRGTGGYPRTVPALLLLPVLFLWEELFCERLWSGNGRWGALGLVLVGVAVVRWLPRLAAVAAVTGTVFLGLCGLLLCLQPTLPLPLSGFAGWLATICYGAVVLRGQMTSLAVTGGGIGQQALTSGGTFQLAGADNLLLIVLTAAQALELLAVGCLLVPRLPAWAGDAELAVRARALSQRVTRLTQTRADATDTAVAELRRIERDLHDGAQARLVAVGMSLRAAEQLMPDNLEAGLALLAEARETSARALDDLRNLVRGIYPPVLADRGLADAVRALALDAPIEVSTDITVNGEPPMPVAAAVYFGIAEALTNAVRHSGAEAVQIGIGEADGLLRATVVDNGRGGADLSVGTGLSGVERRLATFDGILAVTSPVGGPTIVVLEVPTTPTGSGSAGQGGWAEVVRSSWQTRTLI